MESKDVNKNRLRNKTCDTCDFKLENSCMIYTKFRDRRRSLPEENTCNNWKAVEIGDFGPDGHLDNEFKEMLKIVTGEIDELKRFK